MRETPELQPLQRQAKDNQTNSQNLKTLSLIYLQWLSLPFKSDINLPEWLIVDRNIDDNRWLLGAKFKSGT